MKILNAIINLLKGGNHARGTEEFVSGGNGRERRILHSIPSICERAVSDIGCIRVLARTCSDERGGDTGTLPPDPIRQESVALIAAAKKSGCFVDVAKVPDVGQDGDNVLLDDNGLLRFIDPILGFKHPLLQKISTALVEEAEIAPLVYKLYGLTDDEIAIVEGRDKTAQEPQGDSARRPTPTSRRRIQTPTPASSAQPTTRC